MFSSECRFWWWISLLWIKMLKMKLDEDVTWDNPSLPRLLTKLGELRSTNRMEKHHYFTQLIPVVFIIVPSPIACQSCIFCCTVKTVIYLGRWLQFTFFLLELRKRRQTVLKLGPELLRHAQSNVTEPAHWSVQFSYVALYTSLVMLVSNATVIARWFMLHLVTGLLL